MRVDEVCSRLGIAEVDRQLPLSYVSGGQRARVLLAGLLVQRPDVLLPDEPTNHLDGEGIDWLSGFLRNYPGAVLVVSHDRSFLDATVTRIAELDGVHDELNWYDAEAGRGAYTSYRAERHRRWVRLLADYEAQEKARRRLAQDIEQTKGHARGVELSTTNDRLRRYAKKVAKKAKARERRLQRQMLSTPAGSSSRPSGPG